MTVTVKDIAEAKYVLLTTYRGSGRPVASPLWAVRDGDDLLMWTGADSAKVSRLRRDNRVLVQACDARGRTVSGPQVAGVAVIEPPEHVAGLIARKYGLPGRIALRTSGLRHRGGGSVALRIRDVV